MNRVRIMQPEDGLLDLQAPLEPSKELGLAVQKVYLCLTLARTCISYLGFGKLCHLEGRSEHVVYNLWNSS